MRAKKVNVKIFNAYIVEVGSGKVDVFENFEHIAIKAKSKDKAWEQALHIAFDNLFSSGKMVVVEEEKF